MLQIILFIFIPKLCLSLDDFNSRSTDFSIELLNSTGLDQIVVASFSVWSLLASVRLWTYSECEEQMSTTLRIKSNKTIFLNEYSNLRRTIFDEKSDGVNISSSIYIFTSSDCVLFPAFKKTMKTYFGAVIETLDFEDGDEAAKKANELIITSYQIYDTFRPEDFLNTRMIMMSVIYFEGYWKTKFNSSDMTLEPYLYENNTYMIPMMHKRLKLPYSKMDSLNANVMELALGHDEKFCLLLILPYPRTDIKDVFRKLNGVKLKEIFDKLQSDVNKFGMKEIDLKLKLTRMDTAIVLNKPLNDIGLSDIFDTDGGKFSGMAGENLYISSIKHTCEVVFKDTGIFVVASTPGYHDYSSFSKVQTDTPYIFFIMEKPTQTILFGGLNSKQVYVKNN